MATMTEDRQLLHEYLETGAREALEELIRRHIGVVYSSAFRQVRDPHLAEDITQAVFLVLAQKARSIRHAEAVGGWLLSVTHFSAVSAMKKRSIQRRNERLAARTEAAPTPTVDWEQIAPLLDSALNRLPKKDRDAVLLRFFQDRSFAEIGTELGFSTEAARKRVFRALGHLRNVLSKQGVAVPETALGAAILSNALVPVPGHLLGTTVAATSTGGAAVATQTLTIAKGAMIMMAWARAKLIGAISVAILLSAIGVLGVTKVIAQQAQLQVGANPPPPPLPDPAIDAVDVPTYHFTVGSQDMVDLDTPMVTSIRVQWPQGLTPKELQPWSAPLTRAERKWRADAGIDVSIMYFMPMMIVNGATNQIPTGPGSWTIQCWDGAVVAPVSDDQWDAPDHVAIKATLDAWAAKNPIPAGSDGASLNIVGTDVQAGPEIALPQIYACRTDLGAISLIRIDKLVSGGARRDSQATIEVKTISPAPTTQPSN
ncbi:MAG: sigma-70 family RNA polymerase sigma factor [Tepidisphaeraceae bacterium]|jgi:RNA polymerase sigma factor (sigma-70 family)